jgi:lipopolysaccharide heptosyltransferase II
MKSSAPHPISEDLVMLELLRAHRFDAAVIFTTYSQSPLLAAWLCYTAGIPLRLAHCRENPYQLLTDWVREPEPQERIRHEVRRQLDLVAAVGCRTADLHLSFRVKEADTAAVRARLDALGIDVSQKWIVLHPGATAASRRYPTEHWIEVARTLAAGGATRLLFTGSAQEAPLIETIQAALAPTSPACSHSLAGQLGLGELAALIRLAPLLISNNTGPAHIAAAVGTPIVDLYALTNPQHTPWQVPSRVLYQDVPCRFCYKSECPQGHHRCLSQVAPTIVVSAAYDLLTRARGGDKIAVETTIAGDCAL